MYNLILVSNVQHSGSAVPHIIKALPTLVQLLFISRERCYKITDYILHAVLPSPFHFLNDVFWKTEGFNFDVQFMNFF